jgi:hypothetical protein
MIFYFSCHEYNDFFYFDELISILSCLFKTNLTGYGSFTQNFFSFNLGYSPTRQTRNKVIKD